MMISKKLPAVYLLFAAICTVICLAWVEPANQLLNTRWKGTVYVPDATEGVLEFKKDVLTLTVNNQALETMSYKINGDTLFIKKLEGASPCNGELGKYKYTIKTDILTLSAIEDACEARQAGFSPDGYKKQ